MSVVTRHTACVVLLDALGGVPIGNFLRNLGSLCSSVSMRALHLGLPKPGLFSDGREDLELRASRANTHTFRVLQLPIGLRHYVELVKKEASTKDKCNKLLSHNRRADGTKVRKNGSGKKRLRPAGNRQEQNFSMI